MMFTPSCTQELTVLDSNDNGTQRTNSPHISITEALQNADKVFARLEPRTRSIRTVKSIEVFGGRQTRSESDTTAKYYLVNYENDGGFAVLSADERIGEVFAIGEEGNLSKEDTVGNLGLTLFFNGVDAISENIEYTDSVLKTFKKDSTVNLYSERVIPMLPKPVAMWHGKMYDGKELDFATSTVLACQIAATFSWPEYLKIETDNGIEFRDINWPVIRECWLPENDERAYMCDYYRDVIELFKTINPFFGFEGRVERIDRCFEKISYKAEMFTSSYDDFVENPYTGNNTEFKKCLDAGKIVLASNNQGEGATSDYLWIIDGYIKDYLLYQQQLSQFDIDIMFHCVWGNGKKNNGYFMFVDYDYYDGCWFNGNPVIVDNPTPGYAAWLNNLRRICFYKVSPKNNN